MCNRLSVKVLGRPPGWKPPGDTRHPQGIRGHHRESALRRPGLRRQRLGAGAGWALEARGQCARRSSCAVACGGRGTARHSAATSSHVLPSRPLRPRLPRNTALPEELRPLGLTADPSNHGPESDISWLETYQRRNWVRRVTGKEP